VLFESAIWPSGEKTHAKEKGPGFDSPAKQWFVDMYFSMQIFGKQSYSRNARIHVLVDNIISWESNRGSQEQDIRSTPNFATHATSLLLVAYLWYCELYIHLTLVNFTTVQMNETEPIRSNSAVLQHLLRSRRKVDSQLQSRIRRHVPKNASSIYVEHSCRIERSP